MSNYPSTGRIVTPLIVYRGESREECEAWLAANPHPPWKPPKGKGAPIEACSGPFRIVYKERSWLPKGRQWQVLAAHGKTQASRSGRL